MKIRMIEKATAYLITTLMILAVSGAAIAADYSVGYYEAGKTTLDGGNQGIKFQYGVGGVRQFTFPTGTQARILGPGTDSLVTTAQTQLIWGTYQLSNSVLPGYGTDLVYGLTKVGPQAGRNEISIGDGAYLYAESTAFQINFTNHTISWNDLTNVAIDNTTIGSDALANLMMATSRYAFTSFNFQALEAEKAWREGTAVLANQTQARFYYSRLEGFSGVPEPAEWILMFIGLGMLGFYLQRRGYLNIDLSPQSVA